LTKPAALNENRDFRRLYSRGKSLVNPALVTYVMKNRAGFCRVGITTSKKIGNAVERNRARRVIREAYRQLQPKIKGNYDLVFVARVRTIRMKSTDIQAVMTEQLARLGLIAS
jgi:ribonuclease P protein component